MATPLEARSIKRYVIVLVILIAAGGGLLCWLLNSEPNHATATPARETVIPNSSALPADAVAIAIPASVSTTLGGQLRVGDVVDLVAIAKGATQVKTFERLLVLSTPSGKDKDANAITLAIPGAQRDEFALAITGAELLVTRRIGK